MAEVTEVTIPLTRELETMLDGFMRARGITDRTEAAGLALRKTLEREPQGLPEPDVRKWVGWETPESPAPRLRSAHDIWD
jgi:hypothetical protein